MPQNIFLQFLWDYGYIVLLAGLFLELLAFPIPGEVLMTYSGFLVFQGQLHWLLSIVFAGVGTISGITVSYWIGSRLGRPFFEKYGHYIHFGPEKIARVSSWFAKYGNWVLVFAYFIPGLRHLTGYFSGISRIPFRQFSRHAYLGAFCWAATFISFGKIIGPRWERFHEPIRKYLFIGCLIIITAGTIVYLYKNYRLPLQQCFYQCIIKIVAAVHSLRRAKVMLSVTLVFFLGLAFFMIRLIKIFLANEFHQFNQVALSLLTLIFAGPWVALIRAFGILAGFPALGIVAGLTLVMIWRKAKDRLLETLSLALVSGGGLILKDILHLIFGRLNPIDDPLQSILHQFPSEKTLLVIAVYGFSAFMLVRHTRNIWLRTLISPAVIGIVVLTGLNQVFFKIQYPSDVLAGFIFGGVWLSMNILWFEIFRILRQDNFLNRQWLE